MALEQRLICASAALAEGGDGVRFALPAPGGGELQAFAVRYDGGVHAYVNRCPHAGTELDWEPGRFFDLSGLYLVCATHGALFEPEGGKCVGGPCRGARLEPVAVRERDGGVYLDIATEPEGPDPR